MFFGLLINIKTKNPMVLCLLNLYFLIELDLILKAVEEAEELDACARTHEC